MPSLKIPFPGSLGAQLAARLDLSDAPPRATAPSNGHAGMRQSASNSRAP